MSGDSFRDPELQRAAAGQPLANVPTIYSFRKPERDWIGWLFDELMPVRPDACVLDVGCGPGPYVPVARRRAHGGFVVPLDISIDRLTAVEPPGRVLADVVRLPLADGSVDVALAMHMLYHLPDIHAGLREIRRVLCPSGVLYALTNSERDMPELAELYVSCGLAAPEGMGGMAFTAENGVDLLRSAFTHVERIELHNSSLVVSDARAVVAEAARLRYGMEPHLRTGVSWEAFLGRVSEDVTGVIAEAGAFTITEHQALFVCR